VSDSESPRTAPPRVVLCSSDAFGEPALVALHETEMLVGLVTQPDRERGRGRRVEALPIKALAESLGIPVLTPEKLADPEARAALAALNPDFLVIAAYAQYLPKSVRDIPHIACLNIHPSLLPLYRGSAPVQAALWYGDAATGVAIHFTEKGIDTGAILAVEKVVIDPDATGGSLRVRLGEIGATLLMQVINGLHRGLVPGVEQDHEQATVTRLLTPDDRELPLELTATELVNRIRALAPDAAAHIPWGFDALRILSATALPVTGDQPPSGIVVRLSKSRLAIACGEGLLEPLEVQPAGGKVMPMASFLNGLRDVWPDWIASRPGDLRPLAVPIAEAHRLKAIESGGVHG